MLRTRITPTFSNKPVRLVAALIVGMAIANLFVYSAFDTNVDLGGVTALLCGILIGQFFGQLNLISIWAAVSSGSLMTRLPWAMLLTTLMGASFTSGVRVTRQSFDGDVYAVLIVLAVCCLIAQVPLWIASRIFGWRLVFSEDEISDGRFNLSQMFLGTFLLAFTLAVGRVVVTTFANANELDTSSPLDILRDTTTISFLSAFVICNLVLVLPCIWAAFFFRLDGKRIAIAIGVAFAVSALEFGGLCLAIGGPEADEVQWWLFFCGINVGQMAIVLGCLRLLRDFAGFRLVRSNEAKADMPSTVSTDA